MTEEKTEFHTRKKPVRFYRTQDDVREMRYGDIKRVTDGNHRYDLSWVARHDKDGMNSGETNNLTRENLLKGVGQLKQYGDYLYIRSKTMRMGRVQYQPTTAVAHADRRRVIYNPTKVLDGLRGEYFPHKIMALTENDLLLGNHHHNYREVFFIPEGDLKIVLADPRDPDNIFDYRLRGGSRILIPAGLDHVVKGKKGSIIMGWGTKEFSPKGLIPTESSLLEKLVAELNK